MTCAKITVAAILVCRDGGVTAGENFCMNPQEVCPRAVGEGYSKCTDVCNQPGHAEENAIWSAINSGFDVREGIIFLAGHNGPCARCKELMDAYSISYVVLTPDANNGVPPTNF